MSELSGSKRIAKNTLMLYIRMGVTMIISLYTSRIVLQQLGEVDYGLYSVVGGVITMFTFINGALSGATSRFLTFELGTGNKERLQKTFNAAIINHWLLALIILVLAETIGLWFLYNKLVIPAERFDAALWVYQCSIIGTVLRLTLVPYNALIIAHEKMSIYAYISISETFLKLLLVLILPYITYDKLGYWASVGLISTFINFFFYRYYCKFKFPESKYKIHKDWDYYKKMFSYSMWDFLGSMSSLAQGQGLNMMLNMFFGPAVNSARGIAMTVQGAVTQFSSQFFIASKPQIIKLYAKGEINEMLKLVYSTSCFSYYLLFIFALPLCIDLEYVLKLWLGEYPDYTVTFTYLIICNSLIWSIKSSRVTMQHATGFIKLSNITVGTILCMTLPVSYVFLKLDYSPNSVFVITIIMTSLAELVACFVLKKSLNYSISKYLLNVYGRCLIVSILASILPLFVHSMLAESFLRLAFTTLVSTTSVLIIAYLIGFSKETQILIRSFLTAKFAQILNIQ